MLMARIADRVSVQPAMVELKRDSQQFGRAGVQKCSDATVQMQPKHVTPAQADEANYRIIRGTLLFNNPATQNAFSVTLRGATYQPTSAHSVGLAHVRVVKAWLADQDSQRMRHTEASVEGGWLLPARPNSQDQSAWPSTRREQQHRTSTPGRPCPALAGSGASGPVPGAAPELCPFRVPGNRAGIPRRGYRPTEAPAHRPAGLRAAGPGPVPGAAPELCPLGVLGNRVGMPATWGPAHCAHHPLI